MEPTTWLIILAGFLFLPAYVVVLSMASYFGKVTAMRMIFKHQEGGEINGKAKEEGPTVQG